MEHLAINWPTPRKQGAHIWLDAGFSLRPSATQRRMASEVNN